MAIIAPRAASIPGFWIAVGAENADRLVRLIRELGFEVPEFPEELFLAKGRIIRLGDEPTRIGILTEISGCDFADCNAHRLRADIDGIEVDLNSRSDLIRNRLKAGRLQDSADAQRLSRFVESHCLSNA